MSNDVKLFVDGFKVYLRQTISERQGVHDASASMDSRKQLRQMYKQGLLDGLGDALQTLEEYYDGYSSSHQVSESHESKRNINEQRDTIDDIFVKKFMDKVIMSETKGYR